MKLCKISKKIKQEAYKKLTAKKNKAMDKSFRSIPFSKRIIFVPHCLRSSAGCKAKELGSYYLCDECGLCKISSITKKARELGYIGTYILKGGKTIEKLIEEIKPEGVIGVACYFEGALGIEILEDQDKKIAVQFVPLTKDGCSDTDVELEDVIKTLETKDSALNTLKK